MTGRTVSANATIAARGDNTKQQSNKNSSNPQKKHICLPSGSSSINPTHRCGTKGLMRRQGGISASGSHGCDGCYCHWLLGYISTVGIGHIFHGNNLFFCINDSFGLKFRRHVRICHVYILDKFELFCSKTRFRQCV